MQRHTLCNTITITVWYFAANRENTKTIVQFQLEQAQTIDALNARLAHLEATKNQAYGAQVPPTVITPPTADDMSQITTMLQAVMAAQTKTSQENPNGGDNTQKKKSKRQWTTQDNNLPNGQRSKRRHPTSRGPRPSRAKKILFSVPYCSHRSR
eukprot:scaffold368252_cov75-Attheya_sp.AAC.1